MVPCEPIAGYSWFDPTQAWPEPDDLAAFALMRDFIASPEPFRAAAETIRRRILEEFGPRSVSARLSAAIAQASGRPPTPLLAVRR
jgi:hypothetical protein